MPASIRHLNQLVGERQKQPEKSNYTVVLAQWPDDQKFYKVDVIACDKKDRKCKVQFEDDYSCWMKASELHIQLSIDDMKDELILCCVCDDGQSKTPNEIVMCDTCQQGYHLNCHKPALDRVEIKLEDEEASWTCATCDLLLQMPDNKKKSKVVKPKIPKPDSRKLSPKSAAKKSKPMTPKNLNSVNGTGGSQKSKKTPKIKLTNGAKKDLKAKEPEPIQTKELTECLLKE